jgi:hypothetical protein
MPQPTPQYGQTLFTLLLVMLSIAISREQNQEARR